MEPSLTEPVLQGMCWKKQTSNLLHSLRCCRLWAMISPLTFLLFVVFTFSLFPNCCIYLLTLVVLSALPLMFLLSLFSSTLFPSFLIVYLFVLYVGHRWVQLSSNRRRFATWEEFMCFIHWGISLFPLFSKIFVFYSDMANMLKITTSEFSIIYRKNKKENH